MSSKGSRFVYKQLLQRVKKKIIQTCALMLRIIKTDSIYKEEKANRQSNFDEQLT